MKSLLLFTFVMLLGHVHCVLLLTDFCTTTTAIIMVLYCTVLYFTLLYCTLLYSTLPHSINALFGVN
jgi:hypothetical protein